MSGKSTTDAVVRRLPVRALSLLINRMRSMRVAAPDENGLGSIGWVRYAQHLREFGGAKNPDDLVGAFMTPPEKLKARLEDIRVLHAWNLYHYILARTKHYDAVLKNAIADGFKQILIIGAGTDTRSFRFRETIDEAQARVVEVDLADWMSKRIEITTQFAAPREFRQHAVDLESDELETLIASDEVDQHLPTLVYAEGVTPYLTVHSGRRMLATLKRANFRSLRLAYDGKLSGKKFKLNDMQFRFPPDHADIAEMNRSIGFKDIIVEMSGELQARLSRNSPLFGQDALVVAHA